MYVIVSIIAALIIFAILVIVHEGGHFFAAKAVGIKVNEFSVGMGPLLFKKQTKETKYSVRAFPIGGYVSMEGENEESDDERSFNRKPAWARAVVIAAGPVMNFVLAVLILSAMITYMGTSVSNEIAQVQEGGAAYAAGLEAEDVILSANGRDISDGSELKEILTQAGESGESVTLEIESGGDISEKEVSVKQNDDGDWVIGVVFDVNHNVAQGFVSGVKASVNAEKIILQALGELVTGEGRADDVVGPIGIVNIVGESTQGGIMNMMYLLAILSLNLAIVNILPFPALDGGRLLFIIIRAVTGKMISDELEAKIHLIGMLLLFTLMILITFKDFNSFVLN